MSDHVAEVLSEVLEEVKAEACVTFNIDECIYKLSQNTVAELNSAFNQQADAYGKYKKVEPELSDAFNAPHCYENGTEESKALLQALYLSSKKWVDANNKQKALKAKINRTEAQDDMLLGANGALERIGVVIRNAKSRMADYYHQRQETAETDGKREASSPRQRAEQFLAALAKYETSKKWPEADKAMARQLTEAVRSVLGKATSGIVAPQNTIRAEAMRAGPVTVLTGEQAEKALFGQFSPDVPTLETVDE